MNILARGVMNVARACLGNSIGGSRPSIMKTCETTGIQGAVLSNTRTHFANLFQALEQFRSGSTLAQMHRRGKPRHIIKKNKNPLEGKPYAKGTILKVIIRKPRKPNSANRKCVIVKLTTGKEMQAYVPGIGHTLQEHQTVLVRPGKVKDTPGVNVRCIRGKYDLGHPVNKK